MSYLDYLERKRNEIITFLKEKEPELRKFGAIAWSMSRNVFELIKDEINYIPIGCSFEDRNAYELDYQAEMVKRFLDNAGIESEIIIINDNDLYDRIIGNLAIKYDPYYRYYITTDVLLLKLLRERANDEGLIELSNVTEIVEFYKLLKILNNGYTIL